MLTAFQDKFKGKIRFIDKRGVKQTFQSSSNEHSVLPALRNIKKESIPPKKGSLIATASNIKFATHNSNKQSILKNKFQKYSTIANDSSQLQQSQRHHKKSRLDTLETGNITLAHSKSYNEQFEPKASDVSRNPQIQNLVIKLRQKQREKYRQATQPKYIDQMIIKHDQLLKMIDTKHSSKWGGGQSNRNVQYLQSDKSQVLSLHQQPKQLILKWNKYDVELDQQVKLQQDQTMIKLRKIQQLVTRTKENCIKKEKQDQETGLMIKIPVLYQNKQKSKYKKFSHYSNSQSLHDSRVQIGQKSVRSHVFSNKSPTK